MARASGRQRLLSSSGKQWAEDLTHVSRERVESDDAAAYASLKRSLIQRYARRRDQYTDAKTEFVRDIEVKAGLRRSDDRRR